MTFGIVAALSVIAVLYWSCWIEPRNYRVKRYEVAIDGLEAPTKAVVIGDIQPNIYHWPGDRLDREFAQIQREESPDFVFWLGDYYNGHTGASGIFFHRFPKIKSWVEQRLTPMDSISAAMGRLKGRLGSYAVLGNHDWAWSADETSAALGSVDIRTLVDEVADAIDPETGQTFQVVGYDDLSSNRMPDFDRVHSVLRADAVQLGLSHSPDVFPLAFGGPPLILSGHTHGGQIRLPFIGALLLPLRYKKYDQGWFSERHRRLFVTTGLGTSLPPVRFFCKPEVAILEMVPGPKEEKLSNGKFNL